MIEKSGKKKASFSICGGGGGGKSISESLEPIYKRIVGYQHVFSVIGIYQGKKLKEDLVYNIVEIVERNSKFINDSSQVSHKSIREESIKANIKT